jgi:hypothetical protein
MKQNVGKIDRVIRVVAGATLLSFVFTHEGDLRWLGLIGILPLVSGLIGFCWMYKLCNCSTCCCSGKGDKSEGGGCCGAKAKDETGEKPAGHCGCGH